jgi:hypothetical protein
MVQGADKMNYKIIKAGTEEFDGEDADIIEFRGVNSMSEDDKQYHQSRKVRLNGKTEAEYEIDILKDLVSKGAEISPILQGCIQSYKRSGLWKKYGGEDAEAAYAASLVVDHEQIAYTPDDFIHILHTPKGYSKD